LVKRNQDIFSPGAIWAIKHLDRVKEINYAKI